LNKKEGRILHSKHEMSAIKYFFLFIARKFENSNFLSLFPFSLEMSEVMINKHIICEGCMLSDLFLLCVGLEEAS